MPKDSRKNNFPDSLAIIFLFALLIGVIFNQLPKDSPYLRHYYFLSRSFIEGKLEVTNQIEKTFASASQKEKVFDYAIVNSRYYVYLGVFPAIIGLPFLIFGPEGYSTALVIFFFFLTLIYIAKLANHFLKKDRLFYPLLLFVGSPLLTTIVWRGPWYLAGLMTACFGLLFLWYSQIKKKSWGNLFLLANFLTRPTTIFYFLIPFFELFSLSNKKRGAFLFLILTVGLAFSIFAGYNYLRFKNPFEAGYKYAVVPQEEFREYRKEDSAKGHLLSNIIYLLINPPRPLLDKTLRFVFPFFELSRNGVGLLFVIPWFLPYLIHNSKKLSDWPYLTTIILIFFSIISFRGEGSFQIGPRYACDFLPLIYFINLKWFSENKKIIPVFRKLLLVSVFLNLYFFFLLNLGHLGPN